MVLEISNNWSIVVLVSVRQKRAFQGFWRYIWKSAVESSLNVIWIDLVIAGYFKGLSSQYSEVALQKRFTVGKLSKMIDVLARWVATCRTQITSSWATLWTEDSTAWRPSSFYSHSRYISYLTSNYSGLNICLLNAVWHSKRGAVKLMG